MTVAAMAAAVALSSCSDTVNCTTELRNSLVVTVRNAAGSEICNAIVTATDGDFSARLTDGGTPPCPYVGPPERKGTYTVTARLDGQSGSVNGIQVTGDRCHVNPRTVTVTIR